MLQPLLSKVLIWRDPSLAWTGIALMMRLGNASCVSDRINTAAYKFEARNELDTSDAWEVREQVCKRVSRLRCHIINTFILLGNGTAERARKFYQHFMSTRKHSLVCKQWLKSQQRVWKAQSKSDSPKSLRGAAHYKKYTGVDPQCVQRVKHANLLHTRRVKAVKIYDQQNSIFFGAVLDRKLLKLLIDVSVRSKRSTNFFI